MQKDIHNARDNIKFVNHGIFVYPLSFSDHISKFKKAGYISLPHCFIPIFANLTPKLIYDLGCSTVLCFQKLRVVIQTRI